MLRAEGMEDKWQARSSYRTSYILLGITIRRFGLRGASAPQKNGGGVLPFPVASIHRGVLSFVFHQLFSTFAGADITIPTGKGGRAGRCCSSADSGRFPPCKVSSGVIVRHLWRTHPQRWRSRRWVRRKKNAADMSSTRYLCTETRKKKIELKRNKKNFPPSSHQSSKTTEVGKIINQYMSLKGKHNKRVVKVASSFWDIQRTTKESGWVFVLFFYNLPVNVQGRMSHWLMTTINHGYLQCARNPEWKSRAPCSLLTSH